LEVATLTGKQMLKAIREVLQNSSYRQRAHYFQKIIKRTRGLEVAADRIEEAFQTASISTDWNRKFDFVG
jgi:zeaxanthin glucosyltransferase